MSDKLADVLKKKKAARAAAHAQGQTQDYVPSPVGGRAPSQEGQFRKQKSRTVATKVNGHASQSLTSVSEATGMSFPPLQCLCRMR